MGLVGYALFCFVLSTAIAFATFGFLLFSGRVREAFLHLLYPPAVVSTAFLNPVAGTLLLAVQLVEETLCGFASAKDALRKIADNLTLWKRSFYWRRL